MGQHLDQGVVERRSTPEEEWFDGRSTLVDLSDAMLISTDVYSGISLTYSGIVVLRNSFALIPISLIYGIRMHDDCSSMQFCDSITVSGSPYSKDPSRLTLRSAYEKFGKFECTSGARDSDCRLW